MSPVQAHQIKCHMAMKGSVNISMRTTSLFAFSLQYPLYTLFLPPDSLKVALPFLIRLFPSAPSSVPIASSTASAASSSPIPSNSPL